MDKAALVSAEVEKGRKIVSILDHSGYKINVALWAYFTDYEDPRLVLASPILDSNGPLNSYRVTLDALHREKIPSLASPPLLILRMNDPFIKDLRTYFAHTASVEGMRLGGQSFGGRYISDAYIYRVK